MNDFNLRILPEGKWQLAGELSMQSLSHAWQDIVVKRPSTSPWIIDLSSVDRIDSAGVAFLIDSIAFANQHKLSLDIMGLSEDALNLIKAQGVEQLLKPFLREQHAS